MAKTMASAVKELAAKAAKYNIAGADVSKGISQEGRGERASNG